MKELDDKFIEMYREIGRRQGIGDLMLEIFARIYIEPKEIAMDDLAKATGYSLASISNKLNVLGPILNIKKIRKPGTKKIFLSIDKSMVKMIRDNLIKKEEYGVTIIKEKLPSIIKEYKDKAKTEDDKQRLKILESYYRQIIACEEIINEIIKKFDEIKP